MNYKAAALIFLLGVMLLRILPHAMAQDAQKWEADKVRLKEILKDKEPSLSENEACQEIWDILWPAAKAGNLEARLHLSYLMYPIPHVGYTLIMPGSSEDQITWGRDFMILISYITEFDENREMNDSLYVWVKDFYKDTKLNSPDAGRFLKCSEETKSSKCLQLAIKDKIIPSFEDYAAEKDMFISQGKKQICNLGDGYANGDQARE